MTSSTLNIPAKKIRLSRRTIALIIATLLLHVLALRSTGWTDWSANKQPSTGKIIHVNLRPQPEVTNQVTIPQNLKRQIDTSVTEKKSSKADTPTVAPEPTSPTETVATVTDTVTPTDKISISDPQIQETETDKQASDATTTNTPALDHSKYAIRTPESTQIEMALVRTKPGINPSYGVGSIKWEVKNGRYSMSIEAGLDMLITSINLYKLTSEGRLDTFGITPDISTETRLTRALTATHFHHDDKTISFSSSDKVVAMNDGAQDKASFLMQLASIGYANEEQFSPGQEIRMQVAEERDATLFQFVVVAKEEITSKLGKIMAWHLVRAPKPGSYNSQLDIWLAPEFNWFPVQIRNTESNGTVTTHTMTKISQRQIEG